MPWGKAVRKLVDEHGWTPREVADQSVLAIQALLAPHGRVTREQALDLINARRSAKGLEPIHYLP